jgi:hypothetical protein
MSRRAAKRFVARVRDEMSVYYFQPKELPAEAKA